MSMLLISACIAIVDWIAVARQNRTLEIAAKPATLLALCIWFASYPTAMSSTVGVLFLLGLVFSLLGDIFLLFAEAHFLKGLIAFLLAHLLYVAAARNPARRADRHRGAADLAAFDRQPEGTRKRGDDRSGQRLCPRFESHIVVRFDHALSGRLVPPGGSAGGRRRYSVFRLRRGHRLEPLRRTALGRPAVRNRDLPPGANRVVRRNLDFHWGARLILADARGA